MGMFSYDCRACGHPLLCRQATTKGVNTWMSLGIVIMSNGDIHSGEYDGYGRIGGFDSGDSGYQLSDGSVYHRHCHEILGKPMRFVGKSQHADDQGWFFDDGDHAMASPLDDKAVAASLAPVGEVKVADITLKRRAAAKLEREFNDKEQEILKPKCPKCSFDTAFVVEKEPEAGLKVLMIRCPSRQCNHLYEIHSTKQVALRKLYADNPEQHCIWDDDEVNREMEGIRSARAAIKKHTEDMKKYEGKVGADDEEKAYFAEEIRYHQEHIADAKQTIQDEEKKLRRTT